MLTSPRMKSGAPKPNTNFLRHIIRQTDSHNATLLAKEADESRARLRMMERGQAREKRKQNELYSAPHSRSRAARHDSEDEDRQNRRGRERNDSRGGYSSHRRRDRSEGSQQHKRRRDDQDDERSRRKRRRSRSPRDKVRRRRESDAEDSRGSSKRHHKSHRKHELPRSPRTSSASPQRPRRSPQPRKTSPVSKRRAASPASDSDPLEAIVGPLPPPSELTVRSRGRGAHKASTMGIESRFSSTYDPTIDVRGNSDVEDDWGDALEALRDRARWKQQGADRLRAAGFTDAQVKKWEKGDEQNEEDVVWTARGQSREWDRGKVVDDDGHVELKADFGRLK